MAWLMKALQYVTQWEKERVVGENEVYIYSHLIPKSAQLESLYY